MLTNANMNEVAVVQLGPPGQSQLLGLIPTGWYPNSVSFSNDGRFVYVVNDKTPTGPNPGYCHVDSPPTTPTEVACGASNQCDPQLIKVGLQSFSTPSLSDLFRLTQQVAAHNNFSRAPWGDPSGTMAFLQNHIHHIIYIIKENRTYDQILGDLPEGNGDPSLTDFGSATTPNLHNLARTGRCWIPLGRGATSRTDATQLWFLYRRGPLQSHRRAAIQHSGRPHAVRG